MSRREVLMEALRATPRDLARVLRHVGDEQARRVAPDGWSIMGVVQHWCEIETEYVTRWRRALQSDGGWELPVAHTTLAGLVAGWTNQRHQTLDVLGGLEQFQWGIVVEHGGISRRLRDDVQALVAHDNEHLTQLLELRGLTL